MRSRRAGRRRNKRAGKERAWKILAALAGIAGLSAGAFLIVRWRQEAALPKPPELLGAYIALIPEET